MKYRTMIIRGRETGKQYAAIDFLTLNDPHVIPTIIQALMQGDKAADGRDHAMEIWCFNLYGPPNP